MDEKVVVAKFATTSLHGAMSEKTQNKEAMFYNLDAIISVGYRVNSKKATQFRIWATGVLKEKTSVSHRCFFTFLHTKLLPIQTYTKMIK